MGTKVKLDNLIRTRIIKDLIDVNEETQVKTKLYLTNGIFAYVPKQYAIKQRWVKATKTSIPEKTGLYNSLRPKQKDIVPEIKKYLETTGAFILAASCNFGKTMMAIYMISILDISPVQPCLITMHNIVLINQWSDRLKQHLPGKKVVIINSEADLERTADIYIVSFIKVNKLPTTFLRKIRLLFVDEVHMVATVTRFSFILRMNPVYMVGLSATPQRATIPKVLSCFFSENQLTKIEKRNFNVYKISTGFKPTTKTMIGKNGKKQLDWNVVLQSISDNKPRNKLIAKVTESMIKKIDKEEIVLLLCKRKCQCNAIEELLSKIGVTSSVMMGKVNTWDNSKRVLISTFSKIEVGFDESRIRVLVLGTSIKQIEQSIGRIYRSSNLPIVVDFVDDLYSLRKHWEMRCNWYISRMDEDGEIKEIKLDIN